MRIEPLVHKECKYESIFNFFPSPKCSNTLNKANGCSGTETDRCLQALS